MVGLNTEYLQTNRGIIKIVQIFTGFILVSMLCSAAFHGHCFGEGRLGYASGLSFVTLVINIVLFVMNLIDLTAARLERIYSVVCCILFLIAFMLLIWFLIVHGTAYSTIIVAAILIFFMFTIYLWSVKILQEEISNH